MGLTDWHSLHGQYFRNTRVLITGGAGFIGCHLGQTLLELGASVTILDDLSGSTREHVDAIGRAHPDRLRFVPASILDEASLKDAIQGAAYVFHQAALGSVPRSLEQPERYVQVNIVGTQKVLEAARQAGVKRVMFAASSSAYGDAPTLPKREDMPVRACSPYAATKAACEALMMAYSAGYGLDTVSLRYFNIFGPRQNANSAYAAVIAAFAKSMLEHKPPVIFGDGEQSRDFTFVHNAVHANLLAARCDHPLHGQIINVACAVRITVNHLAHEMMRLLKITNLQPQYQPDRAGDVKHSLADLSKANSLLGYQPLVSFEEGLAQTVAWYEKQFAQTQR